jgi:FtsH-binding integral membrane protein
VFHPVPVSEIAIFAGLIGVVVGATSSNRTALITGIAVCVLGVLEVTAREHFSGYRSHATLLAAVPAVGLVAASVAAFGTPGQRGTRELMLGAAVPVFGVLFWALRKRFRSARQARIVRPPAA